MNRFAFNATSFFIKRLYNISKANVILRGEKNIPAGSIVFTINHFTRVETLILPYHIEKITGKPVWSLAHHSLFKGALADFLEQGGAVSTKHPNRDKLIINKLLSKSANWIIFPEGAMIKSKKVLSNGDYVVKTAKGENRVRTGAATFALRCQFYRKRLAFLRDNNPHEYNRVKSNFDLPDNFEIDENDETYIIPVNITYYPIRARENAVNQLASYLFDNVSERVTEEIMTEGSMLLDGVDIDVSFGSPILISEYLDEEIIKKDIENPVLFNFDDPIASIDVLRKKAEQIMYRFMTSIYNMTTLNHDHLFSYILKNMPDKEIDPYNLIQRVYLAAELEIDPDRLFMHSSLKENQISLLTDDRFNKFHEFFKFCLEKNIVSYNNGKLIKNTEKFQIPENSEDVRKVNPVAVFANEIEPLIVLGPHLERLAKETPSNIKRRVIGHLSSKPVKKFQAEYKKYYSDKDVIPEEKFGIPFLMQGQEKKYGVVLMHGFLSSPHEMKELGIFLNSKGYSVYFVRFPGHGTSVENLSEAKYNDFINAAEEGAVLLNLMCENVYLCGISTGAGISLILSSRLDFIKGVVAIAPPYRFLKDAYEIEKDGLLKNLLDKLNFKKMSASKFDFCEYPKYRYFTTTAAANKEAKKISDEMVSALYHVRIPSFIIQSYEDSVVDPQSAKRVYEKIGAKDKMLLYLNSQEHSIINSADRHIIFENIRLFFEKLRKTKAPA